MSLFSESFIEESYKSPLKNVIYKSILNGCSPYQIIEQLVENIENIQKELVEIKTHGIPPVIVTVSETEFNKLKNKWLVEHTE